VVERPVQKMQIKHQIKNHRPVNEWSPRK